MSRKIINILWFRNKERKLRRRLIRKLKRIRIQSDQNNPSPIPSTAKLEKLRIYSFSEKQIKSSIRYIKKISQNNIKLTIDIENKPDIMFLTYAYAQLGETRIICKPKTDNNLILQALGRKPSKDTYYPDQTFSICRRKNTRNLDFNG